MSEQNEMPGQPHIGSATEALERAESVLSHLYEMEERDTDLVSEGGLDLGPQIISAEERLAKAREAVSTLTETDN